MSSKVTATETVNELETPEFKTWYGIVRERCKSEE
jgi:hypothetical protein